MEIQEAKKEIERLESEKEQLILLNELLVESTDTYSRAISNLLSFLKAKR